MDSKRAVRVGIVLAAADGLSNTAIAKKLSVSRPTVIHWRERFKKAGAEGLLARPRGRKRITEDQIAKIRSATLFSSPTRGEQWSTRTLAQTTGVSHSTIFRVWRSQDIQPQTYTPKPVREIVGIYLNAGDSAVAFTVNEHPDGQGPDPINSKIMPARAYYDFISTPLMRILREVRSLGSCGEGKRLKSFSAFLEAVNSSTSVQREVHLITEKRGIVASPSVKAWFACHARFRKHPVPAGTDWIVFLRQWFEQLSPGSMSRRSIFRLAVLGRYLGAHMQEGRASWPAVGVVGWNSDRRQFDLWAPEKFRASAGEILVRGTTVNLRELKLV